MVKKGQKQGFFGLFKKIKLLVLSGIGVKRKFLWSCNMPGKYLVLTSSDQKWLLTNEISVFFNRQYFINTLTSDFDFWNVDRDEGTRFINRFSEKLFIWQIDPFWVQK